LLQQVLERRDNLHADYHAIVEVRCRARAVPPASASWPLHDSAYHTSPPRPIRSPRSQAVPEVGRHVTYDDFAWARMMVASRNFGILVDGVRTDALVPYADMLNHQRPRQTRWAFDSKRQAFLIHSLCPLHVGQQVFDSYGKKCNSRFLLNYGFAVEYNRDDDTGQSHNEVSAVVERHGQSRKPIAPRWARAGSAGAVYAAAGGGSHLPAEAEAAGGDDGVSHSVCPATPLPHHHTPTPFVNDITAAVCGTTGACRTGIPPCARPLAPPDLLIHGLCECGTTRAIS